MKTNTDVVPMEYHLLCLRQGSPGPRMHASNLWLRALVALWLACLSSLALAADYPAKAITIIVPFPPGGSSDVQTRLVARGLAERLGQPVVVDNRPGAGGRIGVSLAARAAPDGYTLLFASLSTFAIEPVLRSNVGYDPQRDFVPVSMVAQMPFLLVVSANSSIKSVNDLIALGRGPSAALSYASWGPGSAGHLLAEMFKRSAHIEAVHVPYKGEAPAILEILGGRVSMMFVTTVAAMPHVQSGKLRAIAVTGTRRLSLLPGVPTLTEAGVPGMELRLWSSIVAPARTPPEVIARLEKEIHAVLGSPEFARFASGQGAVPSPTAGKAVTDRVRADAAEIRRLAGAMGLNLED